MPLIEVTHDGSLTEPVLRRLAEVLPDIVAEGVACSEEPWSGPPAPGDVEIRFRSKGPFDVGTLNCVIEVRTKFFESRVRDKHERAARIRDRVAAAAPGVGVLGVWLILAEGSWSQA